MPRWLRIIRGMVGTGLTFSAGAGVLGGIVGSIVWLVRDDLTVSHLPGLFGLALRAAVIAFPIGVAFSGVLALIGRNRQFGKLSLPLFASLGAAAGLFLYVLIGVNGAFAAWSTVDAVANFAILTLLGSGAATGTLLVARRARPELRASDDDLLNASDSLVETTPQLERSEPVRQ